jgi:hypothetical protein
MEFNNQKEDLHLQPTLTGGEINPLQAESGQHQENAIGRQCGTYLLRKGLEAMAEKDRDALLREMQASGLLPEI